MSDDNTENPLKTGGLGGTPVSRERTDTGVSQEQAITQGLSSAEPRDPNKESRPARIRMEQGQNLSTVGMDLDEINYKYRWFADYEKAPGRIAGAQRAYWEHVQKNGQNESRDSGSGMMYLMRLPMENWREDLALKKEKSLATMDSQRELGPNEYAPDPVTLKAEGGKSAVTRDSSDNPYES
jgi:hypothetical protein